MDESQNLVNQVEFLARHYNWIVSACVTIGVGLIVTAIELILYKIYLPRAQVKKRHWSETFILSLHRPLLYYVWLLVFSVLLQIVIFNLKVGKGFLDDINVVRRVITLLFLFWFLMRFLRIWEKKYLDILNTKQGGGKRRTLKDSTSINAIAQLFRLLAIIAVALTLLSSIGIPISTLLAFGGIGGLAISFAARDTLANLIGGLMIYWDRPFSVGDWVRSPDRNIEGTVLHIGWRLTCIRTFDKRPIYVPNGVFSNIILENPARMSNRRIKTTIGIRYDDATKVKTIVNEITAMIKNHSEIDLNQVWFVNLAEFGSSSLNITVYTFTKTTNWVKFQTIQEDVFLKIIDIVAKNGAEFAFPTTTMHVPDGIQLQQQEAK